MAPLTEDQMARIHARRVAEEKEKKKVVVPLTTITDPSDRKSKKKRKASQSEIVRATSLDHGSSPTSPPRPVRLVQTSTNRSLPANDWRAVLAVNDYGGSNSSAWDMQFSGEDIVSQYTSALDEKKMKSLTLDESMKAARTCALWSAAIATEAGKSFQLERAELLASLKEAKNALAQSEYKIRGLEKSNEAHEESYADLEKDLDTCRGELETLRLELSSLKLDCAGQKEEIKNLEDAAYDSYGAGFQAALQQFGLFYPSHDLSQLDSGKCVKGGQLVSLQAEAPFGVVTGPDSM